MASKPKTRKELDAWQELVEGDKVLNDALLVAVLEWLRKKSGGELYIDGDKEGYWVAIVPMGEPDVAVAGTDEDILEAALKCMKEVRDGKSKKK